MYGTTLDEHLLLGELLGRAVQQADVRIGALDDLAVELEHQAQHAVRRRMLRPEVQRVVADLSHGSCEVRRANFSGSCRRHCRGSTRGP
jgi:hypothetical protein